jgi:uncharacterized protein
MTTAFKSPIVVDTNVVVSGLLFRSSVARQALTYAYTAYQMVVSQETWAELSEVMQRSKFDRYTPRDDRMAALEALAAKVLVIDSQTIVTDCRDPKDNKFLALALDANAQTIVTGDQDLLVMHPYRGVAICTPVQFLDVR